ncbi:MAG: oxidoreductase molybdopterin binding protein [Chloroflexi bacterium]|nr:oxidoreductase molybdopterin binding protein [Chloroflexota bacterium]
MGLFSRGFRGRRRTTDVPADRVPPGQYLVDDYPVLSAGPTPHTPLDAWDFTVGGEVSQPKRWTWQEMLALPQETVSQDIHCVTHWSKLDTHWTGVSLDTFLAQVEFTAPYMTAYSDGGYTTNLPIADIQGGKAWLVHTYEGAPLPPEHGGPARMIVPHLYFWKSAKWIRGIRLTSDDSPGFWEVRGYHIYGDPWKEQRYEGD